ncbi:hypothetical protein KVT40_002071 [Elsinoe batatas]|uniref:Uncharacterized protein n=1 Tax=Elsinoe batatas TaxID=2601811 RepID=A0A8K0PJE7_9PEZI|nr:hypothetical protein KVT40_002071 [Elsinoe batatas]
MISKPAKRHPNARHSKQQVHDTAAAAQSDQPTNARSPSPCPTRESWGRNTTPASTIASWTWWTAGRLLIRGLLYDCPPCGLYLGADRQTCYPVDTPVSRAW